MKVMLKNYKIIKMILELFTTFFKIGLFTFGGGYGMISIVKDECIDKKKWITNDEFVNLIAVAESTPGPIAVNMATYVGYKKAKLVGAVAATIGVVLPSLIIIYIIAIYLKDFLKYKIIANAFFGIRVAVSIIIIRTAYNLISNEVKNSSNKPLILFLFLIYTIIFFAIEMFNINISSVVLIFSAIGLGIILSLVRYRHDIH